MALSRTARILIAILLLAAAAFFWVNFFYQSRLAEAPAQDPVTATPTPPAAATPDAADPDAVVSDPDAVASDPDAVVSDPDAVASDPDAVVTDIVADDVAVDDPAVVAIDPAIAITRDVVIADLPFLITEPRAPEAAAEAEVDDVAAVGVTTPSRATINPFSPVVVRTPPAPARDVPSPTVAVGEVPVPSGPPAAPAVPTRASAPTPGAVTPGAPVAALSRELPSGAVLSSAPDLLRQPRIGTVADRVDIPSITVIAVPDPEPAAIAPPAAPRPVAPEVAIAPVGPNAGVPTPEPMPDPTPEPTAEPGVAPTAPSVVAPAPRVDTTSIAAGTTRLARFLRDNNYTFTGSVLGPVSVGVFRSNIDAAPIIVALGQTLPNTEIVLTDLRGMVAELTLGDTTQILTLDLRR
jgi:hypothetical protein